MQAPVMTSPSLTKVQEWLCALAFSEPGEVYELRGLNAAKAGTVSGYFDDPAAMAQAALAWSGKCSGVYWTINPVNPALLGRASNKAIPYAKNTTSDKDVLKRRWLLIDFDPARPAGISATDVEKASAKAKAKECREWLFELGWPLPVIADSGNGFHFLYRVDLPNDDLAAKLLQAVLKAIAFRLGDSAVSVDETCFNASRICKLYGTSARKGDSTSDRPHRASAVLQHDVQTVVLLEKLEAIAKLVPAPPAASRPDYGHGERFDVGAWLARHGAPIAFSSKWGDGHKWVLNPCPWVPDHTNKSAYVVQFASGAIAAGCQHNSCQDRDWHSLRDVYEPGWKDKRQSAVHRNGRSSDGKTAGTPPSTGPESPAEEEKREITLPDPTPWPTPPLEKAFEGLAGEIVRKIEPQTEADPMAILIQVLVMFGNAIGRNAHFLVEEDRHYGNLFACLVGETAKGRKGTSRGRALKVFEKLESDEWMSKRIASGLSSGEGLIWAVRDEMWRKEPVKEKGHVKDYVDVRVDEGVEDKRLMVIESEFAMVLRSAAREGNTLSARIREAWDSGHLNTLTKNSPARATNAHISILGHVTRSELLKYMNEVEATNGFANRFLWIAVKRSKPLPMGGLPVDLGHLAHQLALAVDEAKKTGEVGMDDEATKLWCEVAYPKLQEGTPGIVGSITNRSEAQVRRLALLYALLDFKQTVGVDHLLAALALWDYAERSVNWIWGESTGDRIADEILLHLRSAAPKGLTTTEVCGVFHRHEPKMSIQRALHTLMAAKKIRREEVPTKGRPAHRFHATEAKAESKE